MRSLIVSSDCSQRMVFNLLHRRRLQRNLHAAIRIRGHVILRVVAALGHRTHRAHLVRRNIRQRNHLRMRRIQLMHLRPARPGNLLQVLLQPLHIAVRSRAHRLLHMHQQHQPRAALQIQPQLDPLQHRSLQRRRRHSMRNAEYPIAEDHQHCDDRYRPALQILTHRVLYPNPSPLSTNSLLPSTVILSEAQRSRRTCVSPCPKRPE